MKTTGSLFVSLMGLLIIPIFHSVSLQAQAPQSFSYQAIVRGVDGNPLTDQLVSIQIKLHQASESGTVVYCETHSTTTNPLGLVNLKIGTGTIVSGSFLNIDWSTGSYFLEVELDPVGGTAWIPMGITQLVSVPYALFSEETAQTYSAGSGISITDHTITNTAPDQAVSLSNGTGVNVTGAYPDFTISNTAPDQAVSLNQGSGITVGGTYPNFTVTNASPNASHTGDATGSDALTVVQTQGRPVSPSPPTMDQVLQWDGSQWSPANLSGGSTGWLLTGNSGTDPSVNFVGTTDNQPLKSG